MKLHRFFVSQKLRTPSGTVTDPKLAHQLAKVLRKKAGDEIALYDESGREFLVLITAITGDDLKYEVLEEKKGHTSTDSRITLYCAILKHEHFDLVAEKTTELGISRLVPVITDRTIKKDIKSDRIERIMKEAAEQSGRTDVPALGPVMKYSAALLEAKNEGEVFFADMAAPQNKKIPPKTGGSMSLFIGPEGGWTDAERELALTNEVTVLSLGPNILRAETAAIVGVYELKK
jgi:16S rRNA (uracil1498-N3)-methyltransferase